MDIASFLAELRSRDIRVWIEDERLCCDAPPGVLTPALQQQLRASKSALLDFLRRAHALTHLQQAIVPLQPMGHRPPVFAACGHNGDVSVFRTLARCLGPEQPFYGLQPPGGDGQGDPLERIEDIAAYFAEQIRAFRPEGPYLLAGFCAGGTVALELAQQLRRKGATIGLLALIASPHPHEFRYFPKARRNLRSYFKEQRRRVRKHASALTLPLPELHRYLTETLARHRGYVSDMELREKDPLMVQRARVERATLAALARYRPTPYPDPIHLFLPGKEWTQAGGLAVRWRGTVTQIEEHYGPAGSETDNIMGKVYGPVFAEIFRQCLNGNRPLYNPPLWSEIAPDQPSALYK